MKTTSKQMIPAKLKSYLIEKGYNLAEIARQVNLMPDDLYGMFSGKRIMTADVYVSICNFIGVSGETIAVYESPNTNQKDSA